MSDCATINPWPILLIAGTVGFICGLLAYRWRVVKELDRAQRLADSVKRQLRRVEAELLRSAGRSSSEPAAPSVDAQRTERPASPGDALASQPSKWRYHL